MAPLWLQRYYGDKWMKLLNPSTVLVGKSHAVVRLATPGETVHVLIRKNGRHDSSPHEVLLTGVASSSDFEMMKKKLQSIDYEV